MARLHYMYEQQESGRKRFVYSCASCRCVLRVGRDLRPASETVDSLNGRCLGCGGELEGGVECMLAPVPDEWSDVRLDSRAAPQRKGGLFRQASSLPHFSLGFPRLDAMLRPLAPGHLVVLGGGPASPAAELAAFRAQLPIEAGGLDSAAFFVDGGNRADPYLFSSFAKQCRVKPGVAMRRVATCRVFTLYQLADVVSRHLVRAVDEYATRLVVISDLLGTFNEPELDEREARRALDAVERGIGQLKRNALVMATLVSPNRYDDAVASWADTLVSLSSSRGAVRAELLKHRSKPRATSSFKLGELLRAAGVGAP